MVPIVDKRVMAVERVNFTRKLVEDFRKKGVVLPSSTKLLKDSQDALEKKDYDRSMTLSKDAQIDAKRIFRDFLRSEDLQKKIVNLSKASPPDVSASIEKTLEAGRSRLKSGHYKEYNEVAEGLIRDLKASADLRPGKVPEAKKKGSSKEEAITFLQAVAFETLEAQRAGLPTSEIEELLRQSRDSIDGGFYTESMSSSKEAGKRLAEVKKEHDEHAHKIDSARKAIDGLREQGMNTGTLEKLLAKAEAELKNVSYPQMALDLERLYERMEEAKKHFKQALRTLESAAVLMSEATQAGANIAFAASLLDEARRLASKGDYAQARKVAEEAHKETVKSVQITLDKIHREEQEHKQVEALIAEAEETINECSQYVPIPAASEMLEKARALMKEHVNFEETHRLATDAKALAMETRKQYLETTENVQEANRILSALRDLGLGTREDQAELVTALDAIDGNNYLEALRISKKVLKRLKGIEAEQKKCSETIARADSMVGDVVGILEEAEVEDMRALLEKASVQMKRGEFDRSRAEAGRIIEKLEGLVATHRDEFVKAKEKIGEMRTAVDLLRREGVVADKVIEILEASEDELRNREFRKAMETLSLADELFHALRDNFDRAKTMLTAVQMVLDGMRKRGIDVSKFDATFAEAKQLFDGGNYEAAFARGETIQKESMPDLASYQTIEDATGYVSDVRRRIHMIREGLPEVVDVEEKLGISGIFKEYYRRLLYSVIDKALAEMDRAEALISEGKAKKAKELADSSMESAKDVGVRYQQALEYLYQAKTIINEVEGADLTPLEHLYKQAKSAMEMADYDRTIKVSQDVIRKAEPLIEKYTPPVKPLEPGVPISIKPMGPGEAAAAPRASPLSQHEVREEMDRTWEIIREFEKVGLDVEDEKTLMQDAEFAVQNGVLDRATEIAGRAKVSVVSRGEQLLASESTADPQVDAARELLDTCAGLVDEMTKNGIKHKSVELLLQRGEEAFAEGRFSASMTFGEEALNKANRVIYDWRKAESMLGVAQKASGESGKDVSTLLESAVTEFESRNFRYSMRLTERLLDMLGVPQEEYAMAEPPPVVRVRAPPPLPTHAPAVPPPEAEAPPEPAADEAFGTDWGSFDGSAPSAATEGWDEAVAPPIAEAVPVRDDLGGEDVAAGWPDFEGGEPAFGAPAAPQQMPAPPAARAGGPIVRRPAPAPRPEAPGPATFDLADEAVGPPAPLAPVATADSGVAPAGSGTISKEEWLEEQNEVQSELIRLKQKYLQRSI